MFKLFPRQSKKESYAKKEKPISDFIPYKTHWNRNTIITNKNELMQVIKVDGFSFETADDEDLNIRKNLRNSLFKSISSGNITLYFHIIRKYKPMSDLVTHYRLDPTIKMVPDFISQLNIEWRKRCSFAKAFINELYISILYQPDQSGAAKIEYWLKKIQHSSKSSWEQDMSDMLESLDEMSYRVLNTYRDYNPQLLGVVENNGNYYCEILKFLSTIVNCGYTTDILYPRQNINTYIANHRLFFGSKSMESVGPEGRKYAGIVSIREYGPYTAAGIFDRFLQMPFEFIMSQSFITANKTVAIQKMQLQQNRMIQAEDKAVSQIREISQALDMAMGGEIGFGEHHFSLLCMNHDLKILENTLSMAAVELSNCGMQPVRETINLEPSYWGQLPGNIEYIVRKAVINTLNLSGFASMHNFPTGKKYGNHWGEYVTILNTTSGTPFYFNFHVRDVGHTLIIGPTGAGKTVLMNFLCAKAQKFKPRSYFFDKDRGAEIFIRAIGGKYTVIDPSKACNFNPLQLPDNSENRNFLLEWLRLLVTVNNEQLSSEDIKLLSQAIEGNYRLNQKDRKLSNIAPFLGMQTSGSLASRLSMWYGNGSHAKVFDNDDDSIDLSLGRVFGFEMGELLQNHIILAPVLLYLFHRINISLDGTPTMIVLDEAWALIDNPIFAPKLKDWLKVLRKLNTFVIFATQSIEDAYKSSISDTLVQQTATQIFLPNLKATEAYRKVFMLTQREYLLIKTTDPSTRYFLIKQGLNATIAKLNLDNMDHIINVLSGRSKTTLLLEKIIKEHGDDPMVWLPIFYKEVKKVN